MDYQELFNTIFQVCLIPLLGVLTSYLATFIKAKTNALREKAANETTQGYIDLVGKVVTECVQATNQTYVEALKNENAFDSAAQKNALNLTLDAVLNILSEEVKCNLSKFVGDLNKYLVDKIESEIKKNK